MNRVVSVHESGREETEKEDGVILRQSEKIVSVGTFRDAVSPASARIQPLPIAQSATPWPDPPAESTFRRRAYALAALAIVVVFFLFHHSFWTPANGGTDQNGYFVGGKMFADHFSTRNDIRNPITGKLDPYLFVGAMWIGTDLGLPTERYYPKYPLGLPVLVAVAMKIGGTTLPYWINPIAMTLAVAATFLLIRQVLGSFPALMGMLIFATSPVTLALTNDTNSHATTVCCVTLGMYFLLRWWRGAGGIPSGIAAGFLLGFATTIRYTEGLLILPLALVCLYRFAPGGKSALIWSTRWIAYKLSFLADRLRERRTVPMIPPGDVIREVVGWNGQAEPAPPNWFDRRAWIQSMLVLGAWALPVGLLVAFNLKAFGSFTGYDPTNESSGFSWEYFDDNWETMLRQINSIGLFFIFPLAIAGLAWMFKASRRLGYVMAAWLLPNLLIYTLYYWAPDGTGVGYLRFFLTIFPGLVFCALWAINQMIGEAARRFSASAALTFGVVTCLATLIGIQTVAPWMEDQFRGTLMLQRAGAEAIGGDHIPAAAPPGSVIFGPDHIVHYLQFVGDYVLYSDRLFTPDYVRRMGKPDVDPNDPTPFQAQRAKIIYDRLKNFSDKDLVLENRKVVMTALDHNRRVFLYVPRNAMPAARLRFAPAKKGEPDVLELKTVGSWNDPNVSPKRRDITKAQPPRRRARPKPVEDPKQSVWYLVEVTKKVPLPTTVPTTAPTTKPTTMPTNSSPNK